MATTPQGIQGGRNLTGAQLAIGLGALVVVLAGLWFVFLRGGGDGAPTTAPPPVGAPEPLPTEEPIQGGGGGPLETTEIFAPKDPFEPLVSEGTGGGGAGGGAVAGDGTGVTDGGSGTISRGGTDVEGHTVRLVDIFTEQGRQRAQIQVDSVLYTVDEGDVFADSFELLSLSGECATLLFGDDQFTLCEGQEILK